MVLLSKNFYNFHSVLWLVLKEHLHVIQNGGGKAFLSQSLKQFTTIYLLFMGSSSVGGANRQEASCATGLPKSAFTAPPLISGHSKGFC